LTNTIPGRDEDLNNVDPARAPDLVTPAVLFMCREDAPTNKTIMASGGNFAIAGIFKNDGVAYGVDATLERLLADEDQLLDMSDAHEGWDRAGSAAR